MAERAQSGCKYINVDKHKPRKETICVNLTICVPPTLRVQPNQSWECHRENTYEGKKVARMQDTYVRLQWKIYSVFIFDTEIADIYCLPCLLQNKLSHHNIKT